MAAGCTCGHNRLIPVLAFRELSAPQFEDYDRARKARGKPCIRGLRITVWDVLGWLGAGMTQEQILDEHPDLEKADFSAVYQFAAEAVRRPFGEAASR